jgi:hypothetical protein
MDQLLTLNLEGLTTLVRENILPLLQRHDDWIDQTQSPLGRKLHCKLVREGVLPGCKVKRKLLVRRPDIDAYITKHRVTPKQSGGDGLDQALARVGARRVT